MANNADLDGVADEPPHHDLHCLQVYLFSSLVLKDLIRNHFYVITFSSYKIINLMMNGRLEVLRPF